MYQENGGRRRIRLLGAMSNVSALAPSQSNVRTVVSLRHVLVIAVVLRLLLPLLVIMVTGSSEQFRTPDTNSYIRSAAALISEGEFARNGESEIHRTPGYPLLLIPGIVLGQVELVTIILQTALSALTVFLVFKIAMLLFERTEVAVLSAGLYAVEPLSILYSSRLMSETLFTTLIAVFLYFSLSYWKHGLLGHLVISAVALAGSAYVRPIAYYLPILVLIILFVSALAERRKNSRALVPILVFLPISMGLLGMWQVRNKIETGYSGFSSIADENLYFWDGASVLAFKNGIPRQEMREQMGYKDEEAYLLNFPEQRGWQRSEIIESIGREGREIILSNLGTYSVLAFKGTLQTLLDPAASEYLRVFQLHPYGEGFLALIVERGLAGAIEFLLEQSPVVLWLVALLGLQLIAYLFLAVVGFAQYRMIGSVPMTLMTGVAVYLVFMSAVGLGYSRARHPIMPVVCVLAAYGILKLTHTVKATRLPRPVKSIPTP